MSTKYMYFHISDVIIFVLLTIGIMGIEVIPHPGSDFMFFLKLLVWSSLALLFLVMGRYRAKKENRKLKHLNPKVIKVPNGGIIKTGEVKKIDENV